MCVQCRSRSHGSTVDPEVLDMKRNVPGTDGENAKPADQIPGPLSLPLIGTLYTHLPGGIIFKPTYSDQRPIPLSMVKFF